MKKQVLMLAACVALAMPAGAQAAEVARDRAGEAQDVASFLGLETQSYRVLTVTEADQVRGTGGHHSGSLLGSIGVKANVNVNVNVKADVKVLGIVKVDANVKAKVNVGAGVRIR